MTTRPVRSDARRGFAPRPEVVALEDRTLLSTGVAAAQVAGDAAGATAYVTRLYYDLLDRAPDPGGLDAASRAIQADPGGREAVVRSILTSPESRSLQIDQAYRDLLGRSPDPLGFEAFDELLSRDDFGVARLRAAVLGSDEYYQVRGGGTPEGFLRAVYSDALGRGIDPVGEQAFLDALRRGGSRTRVADSILNSREAGENLVDDLYADLLLRTPDGLGRATFVDAFREGVPEEVLTYFIVQTREYVDGASAVTEDLVGLASGAGTLSTLVQAVGAAGLAETLGGPGPFTVFAPTDAAFAALPEGALDALLADPDRLRGVLLYHVVPGTFSAPNVARAGTLTTAQGGLIGIGGDDDAPTINAANLEATNLRATNGVVHLIDAVLLPPSRDLLGTAAEAGSFTTLAQAVGAAGLAGTLGGPGPFTVFAPTDAAFAALPEGTLDALLADPDRLRRVLLDHVVADQSLSTTGLATAGRVTTAQGGAVDAFRTASGGLVVNQANVVARNVVASNGLIQAIDSVLLPPA